MRAGTLSGYGEMLSGFERMLMGGTRKSPGLRCLPQDLAYSTSDLVPASKVLVERLDVRQRQSGRSMAGKTQLGQAARDNEVISHLGNLMLVLIEEEFSGRG